MVKKLEDLYTEFKIELIPTESIPLKDRMLSPIKITLGESIDPKSLPYADIFTDEALKKGYGVHVKRISQCMIFARGDTRSPHIAA